MAISLIQSAFGATDPAMYIRRHSSAFVKFVIDEALAIKALFGSRGSGWISSCIAYQKNSLNDGEVERLNAVAIAYELLMMQSSEAGRSIGC